MTTSAVESNPLGQRTSQGLDAGSVFDRPQPATLLAGKEKAGFSVNGVRLSGQPSRLETVNGVNPRTGQVMQGELMFGRSQSGRLMFWLKGTDTNYPLRSADGKPVSNAVDARQRAKELITSDGATRLRALVPSGHVSEVRGPGNSATSSKVMVNLEDPALNNLGGTGRSGRGFNIGQPGSALSSTAAVQNARNLGLPVVVWNENKNLSSRNASMKANVEFSNDAKGGREYAQVTAHPGGFTVGVPTYKLPADTSPEFKKGYTEASNQIILAQARASADNIAAGMAGTTTAGRGVRINARPVTTTKARRQAVLKSITAAEVPGQAGNVAVNAPAGKLRTVTASTEVRRTVQPTTTTVQRQRSESARAIRQSQASTNPGIVGKIAVRPGINLAQLGEFKLQTLPSLATKYKVPSDELRVLVFVRHGESLANKGETFAGNVPGIRTPNGWTPAPANVFTSLPNGELMAPGGQIPLSRLGQQQARDASPLIQQLRQTYDIKNASVSPVLRAQDTFRLGTGGQTPFDKTSTVPDLAERGMGTYVGQQKIVSSGATLTNANIRLDGRGGGFVGGQKIRGDTVVVPNANGGRATAGRPVEDRTGFEDWSTFNGRISSAFNQTVLPDMVNGNSLQVSHQYSIASQLKRIDPRIDTAKVGHDILNGQPMVLVVRVQKRATGEPKLTVMEAGYYRGNGATPATPPTSSAPTGRDRFTP